MVAAATMLTKAENKTSYTAASHIGTSWLQGLRLVEGCCEARLVSESPKRNLEQEQPIHRGLNTPAEVRSQPPGCRYNRRIAVKAARVWPQPPGGDTTAGVWKQPPGNGHSHWDGHGRRAVDTTPGCGDNRAGMVTAAWVCTHRPGSGQIYTT